MNALAQMEDVFMIPEAEKSRYEITDLSALSWAFRKMAVIAQKKSEVNALADEEIQRIEGYREKELYNLNNDEEFFRGLINDYVARQRESDPDFKRASTPYGTVKLRKQPAKWNYDDSKLLESLKENGLTNLIRIKEEPNKADLKKVAEINGSVVVIPETGVIIDGVTVDEQAETIVLEVGS